LRDIKTAVWANLLLNGDYLLAVGADAQSLFFFNLSCILKTQEQAQRL